MSGLPMNLVLTTIAVAVTTWATTPVQAAPTLEWSWTASAVLPTSLNVMSTPSVMDLTGDGTPEVVFGSTSSTGGGLVEVGVLRALDGRTGTELFTVTDPSYQINTTSSVATGDIDGDGRPEIIATDSSGTRLIAFEADGTFKWRSPILEAVYWGAPAIADLNEDGSPEIVVGRQVLSNSGAIAWTGTGGRGTSGTIGPLSLVSDVNLDGSPDVVAGNTVYSASGAIQAQASVADGYTAVGNFDADPEAEIVLVAGSVYLLNHDMTLKWGPVAIPGGGTGGPPTIADLDGDGQAEIGVAGATQYTVFDADGTVKWQKAIQDSSSGVTGSSTFDFDNDGIAEVIYGDELNLYVLKGSDGSVLFETPRSSCTWYEYPLAADVDADSHAEILGVANNNCGYGADQGVYLWGDPTWVDTRDVWNQHSYHITNVGQDGSIPINERVNWLTPGLNNFRLNAYLPGEGPSVSEPATLALFGLGLAGLGAMRRKKLA
jgi:hypothetical protein